MPTYREIRGELAPHYRFTDDEDGMLRLIVEIPATGRRQGVGIVEVDDQDGNLYLTMNSPVAPLSRVDPVGCLKYNVFALHGTCAVTEIEGEDYVLLVQTIPYPALSLAGVRDVVEGFARSADSLEARLVEGDDLY